MKYRFVKAIDLIFNKKKIVGIILKIRKIPIKQRIFIGFLLISIIPIVVVGAYSNFNYERSITSKLSSYSGQLVGEITKNVQYETDQYEKLSETIIMNDDVQNGIAHFSSFSDIQKNDLYDTLTNKFSRELFNYKNVKNISIRLLNGGVFYDLGYDIFNEQDISNILVHTDSALGNSYWTSLTSNQGTRCIVLSRVIYSKHDYMVKKGYLLIVIDERIFAGDTYKNINLGEGSELYIMKGNGVVISSALPMTSNGLDINDKDLENRVHDNYLKNKNTFLYKSSGKSFLIAGSFLPALDWYIVGKIPYSFISSQSRTVTNTVVYTCILVIILSLILSLLIYFSVSRPLKTLLVYAQNIKGGNLEEAIDDEYNDEISELSYNIKIMVERLKALISEVKTQQSKKREAELKMLQAQINPHFLFNTLNSLKWSAMLSGNKTLEEGIGALSGLLKDTILNKDELVIIDKEINNLKNYATIQAIRYGNSFSLSFNIEQGLEKCMILKFILQPIVENSIIHGIDENERTVNINIHMKKADNMLHVKISDDGKGFDIDNTGFSSKDSKLSGIGINNVDERIKLNFGREYGLVIKSKPGYGTVTDIVLPLVLWEEDNKCIVF